MSRSGGSGAGGLTERYCTIGSWLSRWAAHVPFRWPLCHSEQEFLPPCHPLPRNIRRLVSVLLWSRLVVFVRLEGQIRHGAAETASGTWSGMRGNGVTPEPQTTLHPPQRLTVASIEAQGRLPAVGSRSYRATETISALQPTAWSTAEAETSPVRVSSTPEPSKHNWGAPTYYTLVIADQQSSPFYRHISPLPSHRSYYLDISRRKRGCFGTDEAGSSKPVLDQVTYLPEEG